MKRSIALFLVVVFAYIAGVHSLLLSVLIQKTKFEVFDQLEKNALPGKTVILSFLLHNGKIADPEFSLEEDQEFSYRGKMYDVVKQAVISNKIIYYCVQDEQETNFKALLTGFHVPEKKDLPFGNLIHLLKSLTLDLLVSSFYVPSPVVNPANHFTLQSILYTEFHLSLVSPPPKL